MPERAQCSKYHDDKRCGSTHFPEIAFSLDRVDDARQIHTVIASEKGQREKDHGDDGEDHDGFVLGVGYDGEFVLLYGAELE